MAEINVYHDNLISKEYFESVPSCVTWGKLMPGTANLLIFSKIAMLVQLTETACSHLQHTKISRVVLAQLAGVNTALLQIGFD